jgi:hypothetical protein
MVPQRLIPLKHPAELYQNLARTAAG